MARSTYIYIVFLNGSLFSAFTVKHEMLKVLSRFPNHVKCICRARDGSDEKPVDVTDQIIYENHLQ